MKTQITVAVNTQSDIEKLNSYLSDGYIVHSTQQLNNGTTVYVLELNKSARVSKMPDTVHYVYNRFDDVSYYINIPNSNK